jgi:hypothetical protein
MKPRTIVALVIALAMGVAAALATHSLVTQRASGHHASGRDDNDTGLTP